MDVKILRLITGEDLLCERTKTIGPTHHVRNPVRIVVMPNKNDPQNPNVGLAPWCEFAATKEFEIKDEHVLVVTEPHHEFINQYQTMFGGILTPPPSKLILPE